MKTKQVKNILNPQWLLAAWILNEQGQRAGCVCRLEADLDTVVSNRLGSFSAKALDAQGRLEHENCIHPKYVSRITKALLHSR